VTINISRASGYLKGVLENLVTAMQEVDCGYVPDV
jgi:hypothetical protein